MTIVTATKLRTNLFEYLDRAAKGETIVISRKNKTVARLIPITIADWRSQMQLKPKLKVSPGELIKPIEGIWEEYV